MYWFTHTCIDSGYKSANLPADSHIKNRNLQHSMYSIVTWCAKSSYIWRCGRRNWHSWPGNFENSKSGLARCLWLEPVIQSLSPRLRMLYQLTLQELNTSFYESFTCKMKQKSREGKFIKNTLLYAIVHPEGFMESAYLTIRVQLCQFTSGHKVATWWSHHRQDFLEKHSGSRHFRNCSKP